MNDDMTFRERVLGTLLADDGTFSIVKLARFVGWGLTTVMVVVLFIGIGFLGWSWSDWNGFMIFSASVLVGGGILDNASHRATYKVEADKRGDYDD